MDEMTCFSTFNLNCLQVLFVRYSPKNSVSWAYVLSLVLDNNAVGAGMAKFISFISEILKGKLRRGDALMLVRIREIGY